MDHPQTPVAIVAEALKVGVVEGEIVLTGPGVVCSMTPAAARESARLLIEAANKMEPK